MVSSDLEVIYIISLPKNKPKVTVHKCGHYALKAYGFELGAIKYQDCRRSTTSDLFSYSS